MGLGQSVEDLSFGFNSLCFLGGSKMGRVGESYHGESSDLDFGISYQGFFRIQDVIAMSKML